MKRNWKTVTTIAIAITLTAVVGALCQSAAQPPKPETQISNPYELLVTPNAQWLMKFKGVPIEDTITCFNLKLMQSKMDQQQQAISQLRAEVSKLVGAVQELEKSVPVDAVEGAIDEGDKP